jgi:thioredoxin reductase (NADPH)
MLRFDITTQTRRGERRYRARRMILAIGDMHRPRLLGIPGEDLPHVSHYLRDPHAYFRTNVLIVGGKNSAVEAAIRLYRAGARVTLSYRGDALDEKRVKYWLLPEINWLFDKNRIGFLPRTVPTRITPEGVELARTDENRCAIPSESPVATLDPDFVLLLTGYEQDSALFEMAGVELLGEGRRPRHNYTTMETNVPGLYVAGTAAAGTQFGGVREFIETAHVHVDRILAALTGRHTAAETRAAELVNEAADLPEA